MVSTLVSGSSMSSPQHTDDLIQLPDLPSYERQLSCQIWSVDGRLVARSSGAPEIKLSDIVAGYSERIIDGETWRVYTIEDSAKGFRVLVGDKLGIRDHLVNEIIKGLLAPTLLVIPLLGLLIWISLNRGLKPLRLMARELRSRSADDMSPIEAGRIPSEIRPVVTSINGLFAKVEAARQHEREITAFAAHELRTPLAGLRMQAQISMAAPDQGTRDAALRQILIAVDRTTRLVRQLLAISKLDTTHSTTQDVAVNVARALEEVIESVPTQGKNIGLVLDPQLNQTFLNANRELLLLAMRNLHENAVHHMARRRAMGAIIRWSVEMTPDHVVVRVEDEGPGIPPNEMNLVTNRFFRGRHKSDLGSGLGLSIVELALRCNRASLRLSNRTDRSGLRAEMIWPAHRIARQNMHVTAPAENRDRPIVVSSL
jgi:two-component system sensor histidine kinase QseC